MPKRAIMIHGWGGYPDEGWRPWLRKKLEACGFTVQIPAMPDTQHPRLEAWLETLRSTVGVPDAETILIGHSLGCITIVRYLASLKPGESIGGAVLVAGFYEALGDEYAELQTFVQDPIDWNTVKEACKHLSVIHSSDDDAVPLPFAEHLAQQLGVPLALYEGRGHYSGGDGITEAQEILDAVLQSVGGGR